MPLIPAKCPECGGLVEVDSKKKAAICQHCGAAFVVGDAITNFNTVYNTVHNYGEGSTVNIMETTDSIDAMIENSETALSIGNYSLAKKIYKTITEKYPDDYRGWWGMIVSMTGDLRNTHVDLGKADQYFCYVQKLCKGDKYLTLERQYSDYLMLHAKLDADQKMDKWRQYRSTLENGLKHVEEIKERHVEFNKNEIDKLERDLEYYNRELKRESDYNSERLLSFFLVLAVQITLVIFALAGCRALAEEGFSMDKMLFSVACSGLATIILLVAIENLYLDGLSRLFG